MEYIELFLNKITVNYVRKREKNYSIKNNEKIYAILRKIILHGCLKTYLFIA